MALKWLVESKEKKCFWFFHHWTPWHEVKIVLIHKYFSRECRRCHQTQEKKVLFLGNNLQI